MPETDLSDIAISNFSNSPRVLGGRRGEHPTVDSFLTISAPLTSLAHPAAVFPDYVPWICVAYTSI